MAQIGPRQGARQLALMVGLAAMFVGGCSSPQSSTANDAGRETAGTIADIAGPLVLVTHDSFAVSEQVLTDFENRTGITVKIVHDGDAVEMVNKAILTKSNPQGDVLFGVDNNMVSRAFDAELFDPYQSPASSHIDARYVFGDEARVTPIDHADVCLNYDVNWFAGHGVQPPSSLDDLTRPEYRKLLVVENPATSSPGLAFLLATIARRGADGWDSYWGELRANGVLVVDGWEQAYNASFSGSAGHGDRPIVVSYATSPAAEMINAEPPASTPPTAVVPGSCFQQVEFAGVLAGSKRPAAAHAFIDFLLSNPFQNDMPLSMYVEPIVGDVSEPPAFNAVAVNPQDILHLSSDEIGTNRDMWIDQWTSTVLH